MPNPESSSHTWNFFRTGGLDQVSLKTGADLLGLRTLDQKLWVALSCPVKGLELDDKTLARIDSDNDGRIRVPELIDAVEWAAARLKDPGELVLGRDSLPLSSVDDSTPEGTVLISSARKILTNLGRKEATSITVGEAADTAKIFSSTPLNGDGVIPPEASDDPEVQALIKDIIGCLGGTGHRTGSLGVTAEKIEAFFTETYRLSRMGADECYEGDRHSRRPDGNSGECNSRRASQGRGLFRPAAVGTFRPAGSGGTQSQRG